MSFLTYIVIYINTCPFKIVGLCLLKNPFEQISVLLSDVLVCTGMPGSADTFIPEMKWFDKQLEGGGTGCESLITMMKSTHLRNFNNSSRIGQLDLSRFWRILVQSEMTAAVVIIREIGS